MAHGHSSSSSYIKMKRAAVVVCVVCLVTMFTQHSLYKSPLVRKDTQYVETISPRTHSCLIPDGGFKAWDTGVVTPVKPALGVERNCSKIIAGDPKESKKVLLTEKSWKSNTSYQQLLEMTKNCSWLVESFRDNLYNTELELKFPIAYSFVVYSSPEQFLRLLRLLYRPQNVYCIHPDRKSKVRQAFLNIAACFRNVIVATHVADVRWSEPSLLLAQMNCLSDLLSYRDRQVPRQQWRYVINLCGKELPLISTAEMVRKIINMNGTSSILSWPIPKSETWTMARLRGRRLPYGLAYYKSMTYNALSEPFVSFLLRNDTVQKIYKFFLSTDFPEEHFYPTVFRMPGAPGGHNPNIPKEGYFEVGHYFWRTTKKEVSLPCFGKTVHGICVVNCGDLPRVMRETDSGRTALFQNKYFMEWDHVAMDCMEERIVEMNRREYREECLNQTTPHANSTVAMTLI